MEFAVVAVLHNFTQKWQQNIASDAEFRSQANTTRMTLAVIDCTLGENVEGRGAGFRSCTDPVRCSAGPFRS